MKWEIAMAQLINKRAVKKQWKNFLSNEEFIDYFSFYRAIKNTAQSMALQMIDFLLKNKAENWYL